MRLFTAKMKLLTAVVLDRHAEGVTRELLAQGVLDFVKVSSFSPEEMDLLSGFETGGYVQTGSGVPEKVRISLSAGGYGNSSS